MHRPEGLVIFSLFYQNLRDVVRKWCDNKE